MLALLGDKAFVTVFFYCAFLLFTLLIIAFSIRFSSARINGEHAAQHRAEAVLFVTSALVVLLTIAALTWYCRQYSWRDFL